MKVAIVQHDIVWAQPTENLRHLSQLLDRQSGADLYVLAETFTTGFMAKGNEATDISYGLTWLQQQAKEKDAAFAASIATRDENGSLRNRLFFVRPDGSFDYYDKRHLFSYAGETDAYVAGQERVIVEWRGIRFLLQVCYDLRFPVFSRSHQDYDAVIYVANWPTSRLDVWQTLLKARALENQCFVIGVNRIGTDPACNYSGGSVIIDAYGKLLASCNNCEEGIAIGELNMAQLLRFREKFPVLQDADDFTLKNQ
jgi:predicted amidohydrolase